MSLEEIEQELVQRLKWMENRDKVDAGFSPLPFSAYLEVYEVLAQVKQAQHLEHIDSTLDGMNHWVQLISHRLDDMHMDG